MRIHLTEGGPPDSTPDKRAKHPGVGSGNAPRDSKGIVVSSPSELSEIFSLHSDYDAMKNKVNEARAYAKRMFKAKLKAKSYQKETYAERVGIANEELKEKEKELKILEDRKRKFSNFTAGKGEWTDMGDQQYKIFSVVKG